MLDMVLYIGIITVGYIVGTKLGSYEQKLKWRGNVQTLAIMALVVLMGARMGCNEQVINNIGTIGVTALVMTLAILFFFNRCNFHCEEGHGVWQECLSGQ